MEASLSTVGGSAVISLSGDLDTATAEVMETLAAQALRTPGITRVTVDVAGVTYCDSSGINVLLHARNACEAAGVPLVLANLTRNLRRLFHITGLITTFHIEPEAEPGAG